jgi:peptide/nickel transport system substrate-binding protein
MNSRVVSTLLSIAVAVGLALCSCAGSASSKGNDVRVAIYSDPTSLSLIGNTDSNSSQIASMISDGLVAYDAQGRYVPMVARAWELAPDGKTLTFHLREGVLWHDGLPVTSKDVAYTVKKVLDPATQSRSWVSLFANVAFVDTPDDLTLVVHFTEPYADALEPWRIPLVAEHVASKDPSFLTGAFAKHPIGCGPFQFVSHTPDQSVILAAFDRYWGGRPRMDRMIVKIVKAERTGYESLLLGELDLLPVTPDLWRDAQSAPAAARLSRFVYYRLAGWKIDWNQYATTPYFRDKRVRRALLLALDRKQFVENVSAGLGRPGVSSYPPESPWADPSIVALPFDRAESARLLDEAGWRTPKSGGLRMKDGKPFVFTLMFTAGSQELSDRIAAWMQQSLAEVGVGMKIEKLGGEAFRQRRKTHGFEAAMGSILFDTTPDRFDLYHSKARDGGFNFGGFTDPEVDRLLEEGRATVDPGARRILYNRLQQRLDDLQPVAFLFQFAQPVLHDPNLEGIVPSTMGLFQFTPGPRAWHWSSAHVRH